MNRRRNEQIEEGDSIWMSLSDLAMGGFIIFFIISIVFIAKYKVDRLDIDTKEQLEEEVVYLQEDIDSLNAIIQQQKFDIDSLVNNFNQVVQDTGMFEPLVAFESDMVEVLPKEGIIRFRTGNKELFNSGSEVMTTAFADVFNQFIGEFKNVVLSRWDRIAEIRIEGHTDTQCQSPTEPEINCYEYNMRLSQSRATEVVRRLHTHKSLSAEEKTMFRQKITSVGYSYSRTLDSEGEYTHYKASIDNTRSRRVELRVMLKNTF